uniref:Uncharacterized protein n=1 Tax=Anguilla anguilla TaxID=7936 RepID=A0A0E9RAZ4_ANGAN
MAFNVDVHNIVVGSCVPLCSSAIQPGSF